MKSKKTPEQKMQSSLLVRGIIMGMAFVLVVVLLGYQLIQLQVYQHGKWSKDATVQQLKSREIAPVRGTIYDSQGNVLAETVRVWTLIASPDVLAQSRLPAKAGSSDPAHVAAEKLCELLDLNYDKVYENLANEKSKYYLVKAQMDKPTADAVREILSEYNLRGFTLSQDQKRNYPYGDLGATVLGFVNDDGGMAGLENAYNDDLTGIAGRNDTVVNAVGNNMPSGNDGTTYAAVDGYSLVTTLNAEIQQVAEKYLAWAVEYYNASERGMVIVMNPKTFEIYAMATTPSFDPNTPYVIYDEATAAAIEEMPTDTEEQQAERSDAQAAARNLQWRNKAVADTYEPGSVMKIVTAAAALDSGLYTVDSMFYCGGHTQVGPFTMSCAGGKAHGWITLGEALIESCNVSFIEMGQTLGAHTWYDYINAFGMTEPTNVDLPGEPSQYSYDNVLVYPESRLGEVQLASVSYGQSNKYSALQMITAACAAVNGGYLGQPQIVREVLDSDGNLVRSYEPTTKRQVISNETSAILASVLEDLVSDPTGNGKNAYVAGYHVGGKSGTSQKLDKLDEYGNTQNIYISSFFGFAPANDPEIAVLFVLDEPDDRDYPNVPNWFGGRLAGPSVGNIIAECVSILGIEGDFEGEEELRRTTVSTPSVTGKTFALAQVSLNQAGLGYTVVGGGESVTGQYPAGGSSMPFGGQVILYTDGASAATAQVPDLTGQRPDSARDTLMALGFNVMTTGAPDSGEGVVVGSQDFEAGTEFALGSTITLTLTDGSSHGDI